MNATPADPFERHLEDDPKMVRVVNYLKRIDGFTVVRTSVAPHCGVLYVFFTATGPALLAVARVARKMNSHISVGFDGDGDGDGAAVVFQMSVGNSFDYRLEVLERHFGPD